ncbi:hypothetical protein PoB_005836300 [Plakobranchus ocellatus]|uniref:MADF domain-containing protein n=1 Tax=Plakobranchus ocellatus TaxID=259542 RepID=A0AAV4CL46_9GAST|nr:hypothetical protein PoB_005836300 [Plakobranchus ocellatus]
MSLNEALIAAVQKRQALYDKTDDNYPNRVFIAKQWQEIGKEIGMDVHILWLVAFFFEDFDSLQVLLTAPGPVVHLVLWSPVYGAHFPQ